MRQVQSKWRHPFAIQAAPKQAAASWPPYAPHVKSRHFSPIRYLHHGILDARIFDHLLQFLGHTIFFDPRFSTLVTDQSGNLPLLLPGSFSWL
jgi:hypothetical protein